MTTRLDRELAARGLARSRSHARQLIDAGSVVVNGGACDRPARPVVADDEIRVTAPDPYVSRAAHKLNGALDDLDVWVHGRAVDAGASTGGFTQVLLERGCDVVYAIDVGHDQLSPRVRSDPRVRPHDGVNVADLSLALVDGLPVDLVTADLSFVALRGLVDRLIGVLLPGGSLLAMVKPQFEAGRQAVGRSGVVRSAELRRHAVSEVIAAAAECAWRPRGVAPSRVPGPAGNREYFVHFTAAIDRTGDMADIGPPPGGDHSSCDLDTVDWT